MGLDVAEDHFYTSALATAAFLKEQAPGCSVYVIGEAGLYQENMPVKQLLPGIPYGRQEFLR